MIGYSVEDYLDLIPAQHRNQPRYSATVSESLMPTVAMQDIGVSTLQTINVETSRVFCGKDGDGSVSRV